MDNQSNIARLEDLAKNSPVPLVREQAQKELEKLAQKKEDLADKT